MKPIQVSVLLLTYNPDITKLQYTLRSIFLQKDINIEVLVCDDGSSNAKEILKTLANFDATVLTSDTNEGTILNICKGLEHSHGKYVFLTSPGDFLYDQLTLNYFFQYCETNKVRICFGDALFYRKDTKSYYLCSGERRAPECPCYFEQNNSEKELLAMLFSRAILGATYFRERSYFIDLLKLVKSLCVYAEDTPTTLIALLQGENVIHVNRNIVYYEYGTGISTSGNLEWNKRLNSDYDSMFKYLKTKFPHNSIIDSVYYTWTHKKQRNKTVLFRLARHPIIFIRIYKLKKRTLKTQYTIEDTRKMNELFSQIGVINASN